LIVPSAANNLINLVSSEVTKIDGILNSFKDGQIGGNIFIVNPYGMVVGSQGVINVGSLTAITPTVDFVNNFFLSPGNPDDNAVASVLTGNVPINNLVSVENAGTINAIEGVKIDTGEFTNSGIIQLQDFVNTGNLDTDANLAIARGNIVINTTEDFTNSGQIIADGSDNIDAGNINIQSGKNIYLESVSLLSARGNGDNSNGGEIIAMADKNTYLKTNAVVDVRGGETGDGGFAELSAKDNVYLDGTIMASAREEPVVPFILIHKKFILVIIFLLMLYYCWRLLDPVTIKAVIITIITTKMLAVHLMITKVEI